MVLRFTSKALDGRMGAPINGSPPPRSKDGDEGEGGTNGEVLLTTMDFVPSPNRVPPPRGRPLSTGGLASENLSSVGVDGPAPGDCAGSGCAGDGGMEGENCP